MGRFFKLEKLQISTPSKSLISKKSLEEKSPISKSFSLNQSEEYNSDQLETFKRIPLTSLNYQDLSDDSEDQKYTHKNAQKPVKHHATFQPFRHNSETLVNEPKLIPSTYSTQSRVGKPKYWMIKRLKK